MDHAADGAGSADSGGDGGIAATCVSDLDPSSAPLVNQLAPCRAGPDEAAAESAVSIVWRFDQALPAVTTGAWLLAKWILGPFSDLFLEVFTLGLVVPTTDEKVTFDAASLTYTIDEKDNVAAFLPQPGLIDQYVITFRLLWPFDTPQPKTGEPLSADVTKVDSYLVGAKVTPDPIQGGAVISYASTGPLAPLLGFGATPPNPIVVDAAAATRLRDNLRAVIVKASLSARHDLQNTCGASSIELVADTTTGEVIDKQGLPTKLASGTTTRSGDPAQTLTVRTWDVLAGAQSANGSATFDVVGAPLAYRGTATFVSSKQPLIALACP